MSTEMDRPLEGVPEGVVMQAVEESPEDAVQRSQALRGTRDFAAAEAALSPLLDAPEPGEDVLVEYAFIANEQPDWPVAVQRWQSVLDRFPEHILAHAALTDALTAERRFDEAETQASALLSRHPDELQARWAAAWCAHERADWGLAAERWQGVLEVQPDNIPALCCRITALSNDGHHAQAGSSAQSAMERFGEDTRVAETCAWIPHKRGDWPLAAVRWRRLTALDPKNAPGYACLATALRALNRHEPAERALLRAIELAPDELSYRTDYALAAEQRGDTAEAQRRWQALRESHAGDATRLGEIGHHELRAGLGSMESAATPMAAVPTDAGERSLLMSMEGLGDNCEFGMLQRRFGAEPLGLLRFAGISLPNLIEAMRAGFEGVGDQQRMQIEVLPDGEYLIHDCYGIEQHTFVYRHELPEERFALQTARRSVFLRNKLLEDLRDGAKLFIYRINTITRAEAQDLHDAMRTHGRPHLLCVQKSDVDHPAGTVQTVHERLMLGYVSRFAIQKGLQDCEYEEWLAVCRAAEVLRAEWRPAALEA